jgi:hypothetical protein
VSDARRSIPPPRARAVAELSPDALAARAEELARRWAVALIVARPLERIGAVPLEELARGAPALCAQAIRALHSDAELERLAAAAGSLAQMSGAEDAAGLTQAVESLRGTLWEGLLEEVPPPPAGASGARQLADLGDRLAYVCSRLLTAALQAGGARAEAPEQAHARQPGGERGAVVVDERTEPPRPGARRPGAAAEPARVRDERRQEIEIHDARAGGGPAAWIGSIARQLERMREDGLPFAILLVEPLDLERLRPGAPPAEVLRLAEELEDALAVTLRETPEREGAAPPPSRGGAPWSGSLTRERPGRYWLLVAQTGRPGAERLAARLTRAVAAVVEYGGAPLEVVIGIAVCPDDGTQAPALAAHADIGLYAARSARRRGRPAALDESAR